MHVPMHLRGNRCTDCYMLSVGNGKASKTKKSKAPKQRCKRIFFHSWEVRFIAPEAIDFYVGGTAASLRNIEQKT